MFDKVARLYPSLSIGSSDFSRENVCSSRGGVFGSRWESQLYFLGVGPPPLPPLALFLIADVSSLVCAFLLLQC